MVIPSSRNKTLVIATKNYTKAFIKFLFRSRFDCFSYSVPNILSRIEDPLFFETITCLPKCFKHYNHYCSFNVVFQLKTVFLNFNDSIKRKLSSHFVNKLVSVCCNLAYCSQTFFDVRGS